MKDMVRSFMRSSVMFLPFILLGFYIKTKDNVFLYGTIGYVLMVYIEKLMKSVSIKLLPQSIALRPIGAGKNQGCSVIEIDEPSIITETKSGFPSGHSLLTWYFIGFMLQYTNKVNVRNKVVWDTGLVIYGVCVAYARVGVENCHTLLQVIVGSIIGYVSGVLAYSKLNQN